MRLAEAISESQRHYRKFSRNPMPVMETIGSAGVPAGENWLIYLVNCSPARRPVLLIAGSYSSQSAIIFANQL
jgi:hypothetical protein